MAKINNTTSYPVETPAGLDRLIGSDVSDTSTDANGATKSFRVQDILGVQHDHTLSDIIDAGTAAAQDVGTGAGDVVQLNGSAQLPAVDGSLLTGIIPTGVIVMWSGSVATIPTGWAICDGTNGTPNLTGRFVVHADADTGGTYNVGGTGGQNAITDVPAHTHDAGTLVTSSDGDHRHEVAFDGNNNNSLNVGSGKPVLTDYLQSATFDSGNTSEAGAHTHTISGSTAETGSASVDVRPPYYALAYIMKL